MRSMKSIYESNKLEKKSIFLGNGDLFRVNGDLFHGNGDLLLETETF